MSTGPDSLLNTKQVRMHEAVYLHIRAHVLMHVQPPSESISLFKQCIQEYSRILQLKKIRCKYAPLILYLAYRTVCKNVLVAFSLEFSVPKHEKSLRCLFATAPRMTSWPNQLWPPSSMMKTLFFHIWSGHIHAY